VRTLNLSVVLHFISHPLHLTSFRISKQLNVYDYGSSIYTRTLHNGLIYDYSLIATIFYDEEHFQAIGTFGI
jgi:hypothetical protein